VMGDAATADVGKIIYRHDGNSLAFNVNSSEAFRIDSSQNVLIGKTSVDAGATQGFEFRADLNDLLYLARAGNAITLNRLSSDGDVALFRKDNGTVGSIGAAAGNLYIVSNDVGLNFAGGGDGIYPATTNGGQRDAAIDLGASTHRFKDLHLSGTANVGGLTATGDITQTTGDLKYTGGINWDIAHHGASQNMIFRTTPSGGSATEALRIDSSQNLLVAGTSIGQDNSFAVANSGNITIARASGNGRTMAGFTNGGSTVGTISTTTSATAYNTSSDARLKDVTGEARGLEVINELNPVAYNWKADGKADEGLIAQEVKELVPNAVAGSEEEMYQMDYSKLVVHLVAGMKEQQTQIESLKGEIANLKGE